MPINDGSLHNILKVGSRVEREASLESDIFEVEKHVMGISESFHKNALLFLLIHNLPVFYLCYKAQKSNYF
jgi:hypothetical protein